MRATGSNHWSISWSHVACLTLMLTCLAGCLSSPVSKKGNYVNLTVANFEQEVLASSQPVLVDFWAPWCGPCMKLGPAIDVIADEYQGRAKVAKLNIDDHEALAVKYKVESIPLLIVFKDGKEIARGNVAPNGEANAEIKKLLDQAL